LPVEFSAPRDHRVGIVETHHHRAPLEGLRDLGERLLAGHAFLLAELVVLRGVSLPVGGGGGVENCHAVEGNTRFGGGGCDGTLRTDEGDHRRELLIDQLPGSGDHSRFGTLGKHQFPLQLPGVGLHRLHKIHTVILRSVVIFSMSRGYHGSPTDENLSERGSCGILPRYGR
jgi:hypothetical protein